jgi:hypothetical protein
MVSASKSVSRLASLGLALVVAACSSSTPPPAPSATAPLIVTSGPVVATPTAASIATLPVVTVAPTTPPEPSATSAPGDPTEAPPSGLGPTNFPANINPLTGLTVADPAQLDRRPLAVKVSQFPRRVRPQAGLSLADLVFEHYAEAGVTRMTAVFLSNPAPQIGSIRSARLIDIVVAESYDAMLITSGSSQGVLNALARTSFYDRVIAEATGYDECPPLCREGNEPSTNNLFASTDDLWATADSLGLNSRQTLDGMAFFSEPPAGGAPVSTVHIDFQQNYAIAEWRYDAATGRYARWMDSDVEGQLTPQTDLLNEQQLSAANVVVLYANHVTTDIPEDFGNGGHCGYEIQVWGSGPARLFRNGQMYEVTWVRFNQSDVIGFVGADNQVIPFAPGNTWIEIVDFDSPTSVEGEVFSTRFKGPSQSTGCPVG